MGESFLKDLDKSLNQAETFNIKKQTAIELTRKGMVRMFEFGIEHLKRTDCFNFDGWEFEIIKQINETGKLRYTLSGKESRDGRIQNISLREKDIEWKCHD